MIIKTFCYCNFRFQRIHGDRTVQEKVLHAQRVPGRRAGLARVLFADRAENQTVRRQTRGPPLQLTGDRSETAKGNRGKNLLIYLIRIRRVRIYYVPIIATTNVNNNYYRV